MAAQENLKEMWTQYGRSVMGLCVFGLFLHDIFGTHGYLAMRRTKQEIANVQGEIARLDKENIDLSQEVKALKSDPRLIEAIAREELGLAREGEVIIKIPKSEQVRAQKP